MDKPIVAAVTPDASTVGCRIKVTGANLNSVTTATVGGVKCEIDHVADTILTVIVAADARSGPVIVSNEVGAAGTTPLFTVTTEPEPRVETKAEQTAREQFAAEQKLKADNEQQGQRERQAAASVTHHEKVEHRDEQVAREQQQWPQESKPWKKRKK